MLTKMAESAANEPVFALNLARNVNVLDGLMTDIERVTKQYQVIKNKEYQELASNYFLRYQQGLKDLCLKINDVALCNKNQSSLNQLQSVYTGNEIQLNNSLANLNHTLSKLSLGVSKQLDSRLTQQQKNIENVKSKQIWFTAALITTSLLLALFSSHRILAPVNKLEKLIKELADKQHKLSPVSASGPIELIELEHKLHLLAKRLNQLENLRKAMLRHAAHELKTPLASIKEGCSLLSEQVLGELNPSQLEVLTLLNSSSLRLENLVEQLLDYNRLLQQSKAQLLLLDGNRLMQDFATDNQLALQQHQSRLKIELENDKLYADEILFRRLLDNLLSNAIAHGTPGTTIFVRVYRQQDTQVLEFSNSGTRIKPQEREDHFKPFQRGSQPRNDRVSGSGLGLSIVSECAALMLGNARFIDVEYADVCVQVTIDLPEEVL